MREASWNEMFAPRRDRLALAPEVPREPQGWRRFFWWEDMLTFVLLGIIFLAVVGSVNRARWVDDMPALYPIAFLGLAMGAALARLRWPEGFVHLLALPVGAAAMLGQILTAVSGPTPWDRYDALHQRMGDWFGTAFGGGISNDSLPVIVLVVALSWLTAYLSSWAVFRWRNVWLALTPAGGLLLANISNLPGQFSFAFVVFLLGGTLLVARLHLMERSQTWRRDATPYPPFLSLSVLHTTFWLALLLVGLAWLLPQANQASAVESLWRRATAPMTERVAGLGRLFISVDAKKAVPVHRFDDILPFLGGIELPDTLALEVETEALDQPRYLRAQVYEIYTPAGWTQRIQRLASLDLGSNTGDLRDHQLRELITIRIKAAGRTGDTIFTLGLPVDVDLPVELRWGGEVLYDVAGLEALNSLKRGDVYQAVGSISAASEDDLRSVGGFYPMPIWVGPRYLQLPDDFPTSVRDLALELTRSEPTAYDKAAAIESYLRTIPYDLDVPDTPAGRDAIEYFLFEARRGYFDYHASAMVVMLRSVGIPARLAVGYVLQESQRDSDTDRLLVTEGSAFAWPEVYFPGLGWVEFNPTPGLPLVARAGAPPVVSSRLGDETASGAGLGLENLADLFPEGGDTASKGVTSGASSDRTRWLLIGMASALALALASLTGGLGYAWVRGLASLEPPARLWEQTVRLASWARSPPAPGQTPAEYARTLREQVPGLDGVELLADAYVRHRFGRRPPTEGEGARLENAWRSVRAGLLRRLLRLRQRDA